MEDYRKFLAECLFTEDKIVTYRTLSRALKVQVNVAKAMLYDFHKWQNAMTQGKIHATYLIFGIKKPEVLQAGDVKMSDSAPEGSQPSEEVFTQTLALVPDERLSDALSTYEEVTSFQVYSLSAHPLKELQLLSDVSRELLTGSIEDPAERTKTYGSISNPNVRKRDRQGKRPATVPGPPAASQKPTITPLPTPTPNASKQPVEGAKVKEETKETVVRQEKPATTASKKAAVPSLKRGGSSGGIMSAFSKAAAKAPKIKTESKPSTPKTEEASPVLSDEGEDDGASMPAPKKFEDSSLREAKKKREADLRRMMEESDEEPEEREEDEDEPPEDEPMEEAPEPEPEVEEKAKAKAKAEEGPTEVISSSGDGRRRGKRRVMKKKQTMDAQGYLVTVQEAGWESFSEDDTPSATAPSSSKPKAPSTAPSSGSQGAKAKKPAAKGQGNIMSFFSKK